MSYLREINETKCPEFAHQGWTRVFVMLKILNIQDRVLLIVSNIILVFSTLFLNPLSITAIRKSSQLKNKLCYFVILIQASVDFSFGVISIPAFVVFVALPLLGIENCFLVIALLQTTLIVPVISLVTLFSMTLERYIGVLYPYSYQTFLTKRRILILVCVESLICVAITTASIFVEWSLKYVRVVYVTANFLFIFFAYTRIYIVVRRLHRSEARPVDMEEQNNKKKRLLREVKHAKSCFMVVVYFVLSSMPSALSSIFINPNNLHRTAMMVFWGTTLTNLNLSFNSLIFFWTKTVLRKEAMAILKLFFPRCPAIQTICPNCASQNIVKENEVPEI